jgi:N-acyl-D-aspartate/D-glutamate deacylase
MRRLGDATVNIQWDDVADYATVVAAHRPTINVAPLVGHSAIRIAAMESPYGPATPQDVEHMRRALASSLEQGAWGLSTGLTHTPSALADESEIVELVSECGLRDRMYSTHARGKAGHEFDAIREAIRTARAGGARLQFSHLALNEPSNWGQAGTALGLFDEATDLDAAFDVYPYDASSSSLIQYLPEWAQEGGDRGVMTHAGDREWKQAVVRAASEGWFGGIPWLWDRITLCAAGEQEDLVGLTFEEAAALRQCDPLELVVELCTTLGSDAHVVLNYRTENDMLEFLSHPRAVVGSDGNTWPLDQGTGMPHPRSFGTFPRILGRYVRVARLLSLPDAIAKMTSRPAARLGMQDRGLIATGKVADLVIFDHESVIDRATFQNPRQAPAGITHVIVNGAVAVRDGVLTGERAGRVLLHG